MKEGKTLIIFYSRTGITGKIAHAIHRDLGGEMIEVETKRYAPGLKGYVEALTDAALGRAVPITSKAASAESYDLVIIGTPVWASSLSAPMRTYLSQKIPHAKQIAFFLTHGGSGAQRVLSQMEGLCGKRPIATLKVTASEVHHRKYAERIGEFVKVLEKAAVPRAA